MSDTGGGNSVSGSVSGLENIAHQFAAAHDAHDVEALANLCAPECQLLSSAGVVTGREAIRHVIADVLGAFSDDSFELTSVYVSGSTLIFEFIYTAIHSGPYASPIGIVPATGRRIRFPGVDLFDIEDGLIVRYRSYYDQADVMIQMGAVLGREGSALASETS